MHIPILDLQLCSSPRGCQEVIFVPLKLNAVQWWGKEKKKKEGISCEVKQLRKVNEAKVSAHGKPGGVRSAPR